MDHLDPGEAVEVVWVQGADIGRTAVRTPHRHDYHELVWVRSGCGRHLLDGRAREIRPRTVTIIGRGQVHVFERAEDVHGAVVRFGDELLLGTGAERATPAWLLSGVGGRTVVVPGEEVDRLEAAIGALDAEARRPPDVRSADVQRHLVAVLLLWLERWYDAAHTERRDADDGDAELHRRFTRVLERDFARHHDAAHYADALHVPPAALARALARATGRPTKELVTDRVMLEAARLLRFTGLTVGEVAYRVGFADPLYFSRAFKRRFGESPLAYRARVRGAGKSMDR
ncbi:MAG TPA: AraC family transcriptional regulator [Solirubrobacteraceae bacterium]|nr:AraC family transcriptional regulator [Solirubrobacteraceae bacterium]